MPWEAETTSNVVTCFARLTASVGILALLVSAIAYFFVIFSHQCRSVDKKTSTKVLFLMRYEIKVDMCHQASICAEDSIITGEVWSALVSPAVRVCDVWRLSITLKID